MEQELLVPGRGTGGATPAWRGATSLLCVPFWKPASSLQLQTTKGLRISAPSSAHSARQCTPRAVLPAGTVCLLSDRRETWGQCPRGPHALCGLSTGQSAAHTPIPWRMGTERPFPFTCKKSLPSPARPCLLPGSHPRLEHSPAPCEGESDVWAWVLRHSAETSLQWTAPEGHNRLSEYHQLLRINSTTGLPCTSTQCHSWSVTRARELAGESPGQTQAREGLA